MPTQISNFYRFTPLDSLPERRAALQAACDALDLKGTILLATEGINGGLAGPTEAVEKGLAHLRTLPGCADLEAKTSFIADDETRHPSPFNRMKVRLKREIVTIGDPAVDPTRAVGTYVPPDAWNALLDDPDTVVIDTRNTYEVDIGTFENAIDPRTESFRDFPAWAAEHLDPAEHPNVAMFCTGGIRCEKATSLLLDRGFQNVFHLKGGILKYLEEVPPENSRWNGECFVFDHRVSVDHELAPGTYQLCHACRHPLSADDLNHPNYERGVSCSHCHDQTSEERKAAFAERQRQFDRERGAEASQE